jgi:hypothetical protein
MSITWAKTLALIRPYGAGTSISAVSPCQTNWSTVMKLSPNRTRTTTWQQWTAARRSHLSNNTVSAAVPQTRPIPFIYHDGPAQQQPRCSSSSGTPQNLLRTNDFSSEAVLLFLNGPGGYANPSSTHCLGLALSSSLIAHFCPLRAVRQ